MKPVLNLAIFFAGCSGGAPEVMDWADPEDDNDLPECSEMMCTNVLASGLFNARHL